MTIKVGDHLPEGTLQEFIEVEGNGCSIGPNTFKVQDIAKGKKIAIFGLPGAFTPTCSAKHVPSYLANMDKLKAKGVDEVWCLSVNDPFVMGAWARDQKAGGKIRFMADGSADYTKKLGLELDLTARGMGMRMQRFSMLVDNGVVKTLNIEAPGK
ncbi:MAG: redoxin family protein, partial [Usitatibacter sp.]